MAMGKTSRDFAEWKDATKCVHSYSSYKVKMIRWIQVPLLGPVVTGLVEGVRFAANVITLGLLKVFLPSGEGLQHAAHECLEILAECTECGNATPFTAEIVKSYGKRFSCGYYSREYNARHTWEPVRPISLAYVK